MRSQAERKKQIQNTLAACAVSLTLTVFAVLISLLCFDLDPVIAVFISSVSFTVVLAVLIFLWKKTDLPRKVLYALHCLKHPENSRTDYCPCCNRHFDGFADLKLYNDPEKFDPGLFKKHRQDVICPFCYSAPRQRILACWANENVDHLRESRILYFAPEYSMMQWFKRNKIILTTADLFDRNTDLKIDITNIDMPDSSYDIVICNHVLEHVSSYRKALSELHRIITEEGILIVSFPIDPTLDTVKEAKADTPEERIRLFGQNDHLRVFGKNSQTILEEFGFSVDVIDTSAMPEAVLPVTGPADYDSSCIFYCVKNSK